MLQRVCMAAVSLFVFAVYVGMCVCAADAPKFAHVLVVVVVVSVCGWYSSACARLLFSCVSLRFMLLCMADAP